MTRVDIGVTCVFIAIGVLLLGNGAEGLAVRIPRGRLQAVSERKCMNLIFPEPCLNNYSCNNSLTVKLERKSGPGFTSTTSYSVASNQIMKFKSIYFLCMFDSTAGENVSCCKDLISNPNISISAGQEMALSHNHEISFDLKACNYERCARLPNFFKAVLPWNDPCYFEKPCQNFGDCQPSVNTYTCNCMPSWNGANCTIPSDMTYHAGHCLDYSSDVDVKLYMKTVEECRTACYFNRGISSCKAFEFKQMVSGNQGNCTLHNSNSLEQKVKSCDMDLYEFNNFLKTPTPKAHSAPTAVAAAVTLYLLLAYLIACF